MKYWFSNTQSHTDDASVSTLRRLELVGFMAPLAFLAIYTFLVEGPVHDLIHSSWGFTGLLAVLAVTIFSFSRLMFLGIRRGIATSRVRPRSRKCGTSSYVR